MGRVSKALKHSWNAFRDAPRDPGFGAGSSMGPRASRSPARYVNDRSIIGSIFTRLAVDVSQVSFYHARLNDDGIPIEVIKDSLNDRMTLDANIDQTAQFLFADAAMTMFETGVAAIVPIDASLNPAESTSYTINSMRVGRIVSWFPRRVTVEVYDDREVDGDGEPINGGIVKQITLPKDQVCIIENPFYTTMNEPSGTLQRLLLTLNYLDTINEGAASGKLDLILQLPYTVRGDKRQQVAADRRKDLREQLKDDELGIGYIDVSEKVIQLNRPVENQLLGQAESLLAQVHTQLGITPEIMNGSATQDQINTYYDRTIDPIVTAIATEMKRKLLTKTARTQGHSVETFRDPLKNIPISELSELVDKLARNAVLTANDIRPKIGFMPSKDPRANELANPNMPTGDQPGGTPPEEEVNNDGTGDPGTPPPDGFEHVTVDGA